GYPGSDDDDLHCHTPKQLCGAHNRDWPRRGKARYAEQMIKPAYIHYRADTRHVRLDPHEPAFVQNPYDAYAFFNAQCPVFFWEDYGLWCLASYDAVNRTFRDKR